MEISPVDAHIVDLKLLSGEAAGELLDAVELTLRSTESPSISLCKGEDLYLISVTSPLSQKGGLGGV